MLTVFHFELVAHPQGDICNKYLTIILNPKDFKIYAWPIKSINYEFIKFINNKNIMSKSLYKVFKDLFLILVTFPIPKKIKMIITNPPIKKKAVPISS
jgi:hypothetical protein